MNKFTKFIKAKGSTEVARLLTKETGRTFKNNRVQNWITRGVPAGEKIHFLAITKGFEEPITIRDLKQ